MQTLFIGLGPVVASALPWLLTNIFHLAHTNAPHTVLSSVRLSFYIGGAAFFFAVLWTIVTTQEYSPEDMAEFRAKQKSHLGQAEALREIADAWPAMPETMLHIGIVRLMSFMGLFCMWLYLGMAVAHNIFGATDSDSPTYRVGIEWAGLCASGYNGVSVSSSLSRFPSWPAGLVASTPICSACCAALSDLSTSF